jgi:hypothetical protein
MIIFNHFIMLPKDLIILNIIFINTFCPFIVFRYNFLLLYKTLLVTILTKPGLRFTNVKILLSWFFTAIFLWKTLLEEKIMRGELGESQPWSLCLKNNFLDQLETNAQTGWHRHQVCITTRAPTTYIYNDKCRPSTVIHDQRHKHDERQVIYYDKASTTTISMLRHVVYYNIAINLSIEQRKLDGRDTVYQWFPFKWPVW